MIIKSSVFIILSLPLVNEPLKPEPVIFNEYQSPTMNYDPFENYEKIQLQNIMNTIMEQTIKDSDDNQ